MRPFIIASFIFSASFPAGAEDKINLQNGDHFVGKVIALKDGLIELQTPHSDAHLKILNDKLVQLNFSPSNESASTDEDLPKNSQEVMLRNGDVFPGEIVGLSETHLSFQTWFTGQLEIPREMIDSVFFGVTPQRNLYRGPRGLDSWTQSENDQWKFDECSLASNEKGFIGRDFKLSQNFIFSTTIGWENSPNMRVHLCTKKETAGKDGADDSYLIYVNSSGIQVKRVMPAGHQGGKYMTLVSHTANLREQNTNSIHLELRVDRDSKLLRLYLDGNELEKGVDLETPPSGSCILFESLNSGTGNTTISDIIIHEWDTTTQRLRLEARAEDDLDTLSVDDGDRFSGQVVSYDPADPLKPFLVKTKLSPDPISIPLANCAVMYFSKNPSNPPAKGQYHLDLRTGGSLTLSGIQLGPEKLTAEHPWLGKLEIDRRAMQSISKGK